MQQRFDQKKDYSAWQVLVSILTTFTILGFIFVVAIVAMTPMGQSLRDYLRFLFATDSIQIWWYVTRASGIIAYLL
jgi:hypothetical protein